MGKVLPLLVALVLSLFLRVVRAQSGDSEAAREQTRTLSGTVSDMSGAKISGALVTASCSTVQNTVSTDSSGVYRLELSP